MSRLRSGVPGGLVTIALVALGLATFPDAVSGLLAAAVAAAACWTRARRSRTRGTRRGWGLLAAAGVAWTGGEAVRALYDVRSPSVADLAFLALPPLVVAGLLSFPAARVQGRLRARVVLDALIVASSALFVGWIVALASIYEDARGSATAQAVSLAYPIADTVLVFVAVFVAGRVRAGGLRRSFVLVTAGFAVVAVTGWFVGFLLVALAAHAAGRVVPDTDVDHQPPAKPSNVLFPYIPSALAVVAALGAAATAQLDAFLTVDGFVLIALVVTRQLLTLLENTSLTRRLEASVEARTAQLREQGARFAALARRTSDLVGIVGADGVVLYQSESIEGILGLTVDQVLGSDFRLLVHPDDRPHWNTAVAEASADRSRPAVVEWRVWHAEGSWRVLETTVSDLLDEPSVGGFVLNARDVTERKKLEQELRYNAFHDALTGLANRALFCDRLQHALAASSRYRHTVAVLLVDLHEFKAVNDVHGREAGDDVLIDVADRLRRSVREADTVARFGGDEFAVLLEHADGEHEAVRVAHRVLAELERPHCGPLGEVVVHAAVGIATGLGGEDPELLLRNADVAVYEAKKGGGRGVEVFRPHMQEAVLERMRTEAQLRGAVERDELVVHYQPIVDTDTGAFVAVEALVRWAPEEGVLVPPAEFIPIAEGSGMIVPIGAWVLAQACADVADWRTPDGRPVELNVNLSTRQLTDNGFVATVRQALEATSFDPSRLTLEITESMLLDNADAVDGRLRDLKAMGVKLAIDDFGTGYSSLAYLQRLPVEELKIDRRFVSALRDNPRDTGVVQTILSLARHFNLRVVAEGVEEERELHTLVRLGCRRVQGFLFARPMPAADLRSRLQEPALGRTLLP